MKTHVLLGTMAKTVTQNAGVGRIKGLVTLLMANVHV